MQKNKFPKVVKLDIDFKNQPKLRLNITGFKSSKEVEAFCSVVSKLKRGFHRYYFSFKDNGHLEFADEIDTKEFKQWAEDMTITEKLRKKVEENKKPRQLMTMSKLKKQKGWPVNKNHDKSN